MKTAKIKSIVTYAEDDGVQPLKDAAYLAGKMGARLKLVDVLVPSDIAIVESRSPSLAKLIREAKLDRLMKFEEQMRSSGVKIRTELIEDEIDIAIVRDVLKHKHQLLVIGSGEARGRHLTTVEMRLLRKCPCPVWVSGALRSNSTPKILAAVDVPAGDVDRLKLSSKVLGMARVLAEQCGGDLHVLNAWQAYGESMLRNARFGTLRGEVTSYIRETQLSQAEELAALLKRTRVILSDDRVHLIKGRAGEVIPRFCKENKIDVLILGTIARTGLGAALIGNTAETVVDQVNCSILAVKPDGFVSPIRLG